ncbi:unnamed protein product [Umbelopsis sp. WA50703]
MAKLYEAQPNTSNDWDLTQSGCESTSQPQEDTNLSRELPQETAKPAPRRNKHSSSKIEGRQEFATLAIVFGREEYTEPKPLWERAEEQQGHVEIKARSIISTSYGTPSPDAQSISQIVNSSFADISEDFDQRPAFLRKESDTIVPNFSLPQIPMVASFPEYDSDNKGTSHIASNESSILSISDSYRISSSTPENYTRSNGNYFSDEYDVAPPLLFLDYPPAIFDALVSDVDERIIVWGADPNKAEQPLPTTTVSAPITTPKVQGFSSNVTSPAQIKPPARSLRRKISQSLSANIIRTSLQTAKRSPSMLFQRKSSISSDRDTSLDSSDFLEPNRTNIDMKQSTDNMVIEAATVEKLVEKLTNTLDYGILTDFFLTYRTFISPLQLCKLLILRFRWSLTNDEEARRIVRIRTFVVIRHWLLNYFVHDFTPSRPLRSTLITFINQLAFHPLVRQSVRDQRIVKGLKRIFRRLKMVHYRNSRSDHVRIISPPPATPEQEKIEKLIREKFLQNNSRRSAMPSMGKFKLTGAKMDGNTAITDANLASVVVIGNLHKKGGNSSYLGHQESQGLGRKVMRTMSMNDLKSSLLQSSVRHSTIHQAQDNPRFVSIKTLQMQRRAEIEQQQNEAERDYERQRRLEGRPLSIASDDSLESELSPGTTDDELEISKDFDSMMTLDKPLEDDELEARELEAQRRKREEEEEIRRKEFYDKGNLSPTPSEQPTLPKSLDIFHTPDHPHTIHVDRVVATPIVKEKDSSASVDAAIMHTKRTNKRPGLPHGFLNPVSHQDASNQPLPKNGQEITGSPTADSQKDVDPKPIDDIVRNSMPNGFSRNLSLRVIERRKSERDLRQTYIDGANQSDNVVVPALPPLKDQSNLVKPQSVMPNSASDSSLNNLLEELSDANDTNAGLEHQLRRTASGRFLNMIAQELRKEDEEDCACEACMGLNNDHRNCKRFSKLLATDVDKRHSIELRHRRGASVDRLSEVTKTTASGYETVNFQENSVISENDGYDPEHYSSVAKTSSMRMSSEAADTIASLPYVERNSVPQLKDIDLVRTNTKKSYDYIHSLSNTPSPRGPPKSLERMPSVVSALRKVEIEEQPSDINSQVASLAIASSSAGGQDAVSEPLASPEDINRPTLDITNSIHQNGNVHTPAESMVQDDQVRALSSDKAMEDAVPQTISEAKRYNRRSFILYERSEIVAQQLCLIERDVLLAVQWEELVHCRWTKMNTNAGEQNDLDEDTADFQPPRFNTRLQHGVQDVIHRFNFVCQWVASEIVRAQSIDERVKTIEKFIRIAQVSHGK